VSRKDGPEYSLNTRGLTKEFPRNTSSILNPGEFPFPKIFPRNSFLIFIPGEFFCKEGGTPREFSMWNERTTPMEFKLTHYANNLRTFENDWRSNWGTSRE
jgi:hypothetical protein